MLGRDGNRGARARFRLLAPDEAQLLDALAEPRRHGAVGAVHVLHAVLVVQVPVRVHHVVERGLLLDSGRRRRRAEPLHLAGALALGSVASGRLGPGRTRLRLVGVHEPRLHVVPRRGLRVVGQQALHARDAHRRRPRRVRGVRVEAARLAGLGAGRRDGSARASDLSIRGIVGTARGHVE